MLAQQQQPNVTKKPSNTPFSDSTNYFFVSKPTDAWLEATDVLTDSTSQNVTTTFENKSDTTFSEGKVFLQASGGASSPSFNVIRYGNNPFSNTTPTQYQKYKVLSSDQSSQEGKIYWCRAADITEAKSGYIKSRGTQLDEKLLIEGDLLDGNYITHEFRRDFVLKAGDGTDKKNAFSFGLSGTDNTNSYHWLQFVWREIYGTKDNTEKFLTHSVTTSGGSYNLTKDRTPKTNNINTDTKSTTEPWYGGATLRTPKTFSIIDRPSVLSGEVSKVPDDWADVHSKFHGITYLVRDDFFSIRPLHEYKFEVDWDLSRYFPVASLIDKYTTDEIDNVAPTTRQDSSTRTNKIDPEAKKTLKRQFSTYGDMLDES